MKNKVFIGLFLLVVVFGVIYGGMVLAPFEPRHPADSLAQNSDIPVMPVPSVQKKPKDTPVLTEKETATPSVKIIDWEIYKNKKYGYEVKYPKDWKVIEARPRVRYKAEEAMNILLEGQLQKVTFLEKEHGGCGGDFQVVVISNLDKLSLEQWIRKNEPTDISGGSLIMGISDTTVDGKPAKKLSIFGFDHEGIEIVFLHRGIIYSIGFTGDAPCDPEAERHQQIYQQMLSTFMFIE